MTSKRTLSPDDSRRLREVEKHKKKAKDVIGNLDYIDQIPYSPSRREIIFPYGNNGKPRPWGSGLWQ